MDREELVALLCEHYQYVRVLAWGYSEEDFEDLANEAIMDAYEGLDSLKEPGYIKSWLFTIVRNRAKKYYRRKEKRKRIDEAVKLESGSADLADLSEFAAGEAAFREMMQRAEDEDLVREIMDTLNPEIRRILYLKFWGGHTFSEIGDVMGINVNTVKSMYTRCRDKLCERYGNIGKNKEKNTEKDVRKEAESGGRG